MFKQRQEAILKICRIQLIEKEVLRIGYKQDVQMYGTCSPFIKELLHKLVELLKSNLLMEVTAQAACRMEQRQRLICMVPIYSGLGSKMNTNLFSSFKHTR